MRTTADHPTGFASASRKSATYPRLLLAAALSACDWIEDIFEKRRSRRFLMELTDAQLKDIGLSRADAFREARRSHWL